MHELAPHFVFGEHVNGVQKKMVTLAEVLDFYRQVAVQKAHQVFQPLKVDLVGALRYLDKVLVLVVVAGDLGHVARVEVVVRVGDDDLHVAGLVEDLRILNDPPLFRRQSADFLHQLSQGQERVNERSEALWEGILALLLFLDLLDLVDNEWLSLFSLDLVWQPVGEMEVFVV